MINNPEKLLAMGEKLRSMWMPYTEEEKQMIMDANNKKALKHNHFDSGYPESQPVMGFFNWSGADFERVKKEYPNTMSSEEKLIVLEYMRNATTECRYRGFATSRIDGKIVGTADMRTPDGKWIFPSKWDVHYVGKYNISPPREFVEDAIAWKAKQL